MTTWSGRYSPGIAGWRGALDEAIAADDPDRTPHRLAEICLVPVLSRPSTGPLRAGLPGEGPGKALVREAGAGLLHWVRTHPERPEAGAWAVIARFCRNRYPEDVAEDLRRYLGTVTDAAAIAKDIGDPDLEALADQQSAIAAEVALDYESSFAWANRALVRLSEMGDGSPLHPVPILRLATRDAPWLEDQAEFRTYLRYHSHSRASIAARMLRDYDRAITERDHATEVARRLTDSHPSFLADSLWRRAGLARDLGDTPTAIALQEEQRRYAAENPDPLVLQSYLKNRDNMAVFLDDWEDALRARQERVRLRISPLVDNTLGITPRAALHAMEILARNDSAATNGLANDGLTLASTLLDSGRARVDTDARAEARAWLDVAHLGFSQRDVNGLNGLVAVAFRRLELDAIDGVAGDGLSVGRRMVEASRAWRRPGGARRAALEAVRWGAPGDRVVLDRLLELRQEAPTVDAAFLDLGIANWHLKTGNDLADHDATPAAVGAWLAATRLAASASHGLRIERADGPPVLLNAFYYIEALQVLAEAMRRLRAAGHTTATTEADELAVRVASLPAIAQRLTASATPLQRATIDRLYADWLAQTAELAATLGDHHAADIVTEVARRDLVGTVLYALTTQPETPERIADLARHLLATLNATITDTEEPGEEGGTRTGTTTGPGEDDASPSPGPAVRGARITDQLTTTLDVVGEVLGPVAKGLFDPRTVLDTSGQGALDALHPTSGVAAVLSLWLLPHTPPGDKPRLLRRLTWRTTNDPATHEYLDVVTVPTWLPGYDIGENPTRFFARLDALTPHLLPQPLLDLLHDADPDHPLSLTVIPTGLLAVPFAALPITPEHRLLDLAVIATAQSLRAVTSLTQGRTPDEDLLEPLDIGIYDTKNLTHTKTEWNELLKQRPGVRPVTTLREVDAMLTHPTHRGCIGVFALAVHGEPGPDGWSQIKVLPSGETLTTGHVLQWYIPRLVVGASCDTDIRTDAGGELGGFPLAFQLRGATTIIGTLHRVDDEATAQIMGLFYAATAAGHPPAAALRQAQRTWINANPTARKPHLPHWAYLLTYGLPH